MKTAIIGGDKRMLYLADSLLMSGADVAISGFDGLMSLCDIAVCDPEEAIDRADVAFLPVVPIKNGILNMPYSDYRLTPAEFGRMIGRKPVFTGFSDTVRPYCGGSVYDYAARDDFRISNAVLTAEGAIEIMFRGYEGSVFGSNILLTGFGRIGKILSRDLHELGAHVTVAARKAGDRAMIRAQGMNAVGYPISDSERYDIVVNTVPAPILDADTLRSMREDVFIIDLASAPGGTDFNFAKERGITAIHALSLPSKTAPKAAGRIIKDTIMNMMKEENGGKDYLGLCDDRLLLHL